MTISDQAEDRQAPATWPGEGGKTVEVKLGISLVEFARVNSRDETFDMTGFLDASWLDPSLTLRPGEPAVGIRRFDPDRVYRPELGFLNAVEPRPEQVGDVYVDDSGRVAERLRFSHRFSSKMDLRRFPFDRQVLKVRVASIEPFARNLALVIDPLKVGISDTVFVSDWAVEGVKAMISPVPGSEDEDEQLVFEISLHRRSTYYYWRILLPMCLMVCVSWTAFWFEIPNLQPQISTAVSVLLSVVTFNYSIDFSLPKVQYLTFIDSFTLLSFLFVLMVIPVVTLIHLSYRKFTLDQALRIQRVARGLFPLGYLFAVASLVAYCLG